MSTLGEILKEFRLRHDLTQEELACMVDYERSAIASMETERRKVPPDLFPKLFDFYGDAVAAIAICHSCRTGGLVSGIELPSGLDGHFTELRVAFWRQANQFISYYDEFLEARRTASGEYSMAAALAKEGWDLIMPLISLTIELNRLYKVDHRETLDHVNDRLKCLQKKKRALDKSAE